MGKMHATLQMFHCRTVYRQFIDGCSAVIVWLWERIELKRLTLIRRPQSPGRRVTTSWFTCVGRKQVSLDATWIWYGVVSLSFNNVISLS